jgi:hypothetical protein
VRANRRRLDSVTPTRPDREHQSGGRVAKRRQRQHGV